MYVYAIRVCVCVCVFAQEYPNECVSVRVLSFRVLGCWIMMHDRVYVSYCHTHTGSYHAYAHINTHTHTLTSARTWKK